eukprot:gene8990-18603_t
MIPIPVDVEYSKLEDLTLNQELFRPVDPPFITGTKKRTILLTICALSMITYSTMVWNSLKNYDSQEDFKIHNATNYNSNRRDYSSENILTRTSSDYYESIDFTSKNEILKRDLQNLISVHVSIPYEKVWEAFADIYEKYPCDGDSSHIPDVYSSYCWIPERNVQHGECGAYKAEGDCFNREHIWPKSWFGGFEHGLGAQTDLFELAPSDGKVNAERGNLPLGRVRSDAVTYTSSNGCRVGTCLSEQHSGQCFEVTDHLKGDFARIYFYLSVTYMDRWSCCDTDGVDRSHIKKWMETELRSWHDLDPVDELERTKNDIIFEKWQHNRNPFVDHPQIVAQIDDF